VQTASLTDLSARLAGLEGHPSGAFTRDGNAVVLKGADLVVVDGNIYVNTGSVEDDGVSGQGNLIVGNGHSISAETKNAFVAGFGNRAHGRHVFVAGSDNTASGSRSCVFGGERNQALGRGSLVAGGTDNTAHAWYSSIFGGSSQTTGRVGDVHIAQEDLGASLREFVLGSTPHARGPTPPRSEYSVEPSLSGASPPEPPGGGSST
jgi:hypothetical protein